MQSLSRFKQIYGNEYPAAVMKDGIRIPLSAETRFSRHYDSDEPRIGIVIPRFADGSATITASVLQQEWENWSDDVRLDFCQSCHCLELTQADFPEMLRFILQCGDSQQWSAIAMPVARALPCEEAFDTLVSTLHRTDIGAESSGIAQGIAATKHPNAAATLRAHLDQVWTHPDLWAEATYMNWIAYEATWCIYHLIKLGAPPSDFAERVGRLSEHVSPRNRQAVRRRLSEHYAWLRPDENNEG